MKIRNILKRKEGNPATIEQMCGILLLTMQETNDQKLYREYEGLLREIKESKPIRNFEIKRIDKVIIQKLREIYEFTKTDTHKDKVLALTAEVGLGLLERKRKAQAFCKQDETDVQAKNNKE